MSIFLCPGFKSIKSCYNFQAGDMMYYFVHENIFAVDKDRDNTASFVQVGYQE
jgi:arginine/lysine/ornithine decarboxylase